MQHTQVCARLYARMQSGRSSGVAQRLPACCFFLCIKLLYITVVQEGQDSSDYLRTPHER